MAGLALIKILIVYQRGKYEKIYDVCKYCISKKKDNQYNHREVVYINPLRFLNNLF